MNEEKCGVNAVPLKIHRPTDDELSVVIDRQELHKSLEKQAEPEAFWAGRTLAARISRRIAA